MLPDIPASEVLKSVPGIASIDAPLKGGQKLVYRCELSQGTFALKVVPVSGHINKGDKSLDTPVARAFREIEILERCNEPHLVKLGPIGATEGIIGGYDVVYYTEEWIVGHNLAEILKTESRLPSKQVGKIGLHVTRALDCLNRLHVVHRDVKPGNIVRRQQTDEYVLMDLGYALDRGGTSLTAAGYAPGTLRYFSPEQCSPRHAGRLDIRSDFFALGVVLYECVTGLHPFYRSGFTDQDIMSRITGPFPVTPPSALCTEVLPSLEEIVLKLLQKQPNMRYRAFNQLYAAFNKLPD